MKIKNKLKKDPFSLLLIVSVLIVSILTISNFEELGYLRGLIYPTTVTDEISGQKTNRLEVLVYEHNHLINKDYEFNEGGSVSITQPNEFAGTINSGEVIESNEDIKDIILEAPTGNFVGWSGCDAETENRCQVSVVSHQKRKIEAHYSNPEPRTESLQLFSVSNNPLGGQLTDNWTNANPDLIYKAAYVDLDGEIPSTIEELSPDLQLSLGGNDFTGSIPSEIGGLANTDYIGLQKNSLTENIPTEIEDTSPIYLLAYMNNLSGPIPSEIGGIGSQIERFEFHNNQLEGEVPYELTEIGTLTPNELRLYENNLTSTASNFMTDAPWDGINFHNNNFNRAEILSSLNDAAQNSGQYIDFCGNAPVVEANYSVDGSSCSLSVPDEVNNAADSWNEIYVEVTLSQATEYYTGNCSGRCSGEIVEVENEEGEIVEECDTSSRCNPDTSQGSRSPYNFPGQYCIKITEPKEECEDIDHIPDEVDHRAEEDDCDTYTHDECRPICSEGRCGGSATNCPDRRNWHCEASGDYDSGWDNSQNEADSHLTEC